MIGKKQDEEFKLLFNRYKSSCNDLVRLFADRYEVSVGSDDWVAGDVGGTICINEEFFLNMDEIIFMMKNGVSWDEFLRWWDYNLDAHYLGLNSINLRSWIMGAPHLTQEQIEGLKEKQKELQDLVDKYKKDF